MSESYPPCQVCKAGQHDQCAGGLCGCIEFHSDDVPMMRGFKKLKQQLRDRGRGNTDA